MNYDAVVEKAVEYYNNGFVCSEAVLMAVAEAYEIDSPHIPSIATAFGSGLSQTNGPCGALSGGILALSLLNGRTEGRQDYAQLYKNVALLKNAFNEKFHSTQCTSLIGFSLNDSNAGEKFASHDCKNKVCTPSVQFVVEEVMHLLQASLS